MADKKVQEITIPIVFKTAVNEYAAITRNIQQALKNVDVNSAVGKRMQTALRNAQYKQLQLSNLVAGDTINIKDLNKVNSLTSQLETTLTKIQTDFASIDVTSLTLTPTELDSWKRAQKEVEKYAKAINDVKNGQATIGMLFSGNEKKQLNQAGIKDTTTLSSAIEQATEKYRELKTEAKDAEKALKQANAQLTAAQEKATGLQKKSEASVKQDTLKGVFANRAKNTQTASVKMLTALSDTAKNRAQGAAINESNINDVFKRTFADVFQVDKVTGQFTNQFRNNGRNILTYYLQALGLDENGIKDIQENVEDKVGRVREIIKNALTIDQMTGKNGEVRNPYYRPAQAAVKNWWETYAKEPAMENWRSQRDAAKAQVTVRSGAVGKAQDTLDAANAKVLSQDAVVQQLQAMQANLQTKVDELSAALNAAMQRINELEQQLRDKYAPGGTNYGTQAHNIGTRVVAASREAKDDSAAKTKAQEAADLARVETEQFQNRLQMSLKQWMGFSQIINIVRNGVRNAYQDIQNLDKAMTNIAVVTDMSVSDLWGKINEYMSIAQQYGVTTQGVYEVSQLFYQQGLGTADVMELTTETLKMARIAGMGYAEAADAMTVAIRGFKLEMSDAQHITDVYSEVAAISASDTQELATAMSKTASSAASVGMSFENTTAMIATMVEATRESATNIGSAMKSIISRMSEMKAGLSQDENGEFLDASKVETALKSVKVALRDTQGQFRDLDTVLIELGSKWSTLDSATKRYDGSHQIL